MACSSCQKNKNKNKISPIVTPIDNIEPNGRLIPQNQRQPSEKFQQIRVLPPKRG